MVSMFRCGVETSEETLVQIQALADVHTFFALFYSLSSFDIGLKSLILLSLYSCSHSMQYPSLSFVGSVPLCAGMAVLKPYSLFDGINAYVIFSTILPLVRYGTYSPQGLHR